ncbi:MAG: hypothetical protein QNK03_26895 [Myxococcota bacterium]|nr:hypothetical protein [Myxococcota bacterium]
MLRALDADAPRAPGLRRLEDHRRAHPCAAARPRGDPEQRRVDAERDLERRLARLARSHAPLRRTLSALTDRLVTQRGWERLGFARLADYARERLGLSARQVYELARMDGRLRELPRVEAAFLRGRLSWSKARLLARVATRDDEAPWIDYARRVRVATLEREVRAVDRGALESGVLDETDEDGRPVYPRATVVIRCSRRVHGSLWRARLHTPRVAGERLAPWQCMEAVAGEVLSALPLAVHPEPEPVEPRAGPVEPIAASECGPPRRVHGGAPDVCTDDASRDDDRDDAPPELPHTLRLLLAELEDADPFELDARLRRVVALEQRLQAELAPLLARLTAGKRYRRLGFATLASYARERLGMAPSTVRALLRLERTAGVCPSLRRAWREGSLSWTQAHALVPLILLDDARPWRTSWIDWAGRVTVRRLEEDVGRALLVRERDAFEWERTGGLPPEATASAGRQTCADQTVLEEDPGAADGSTRPEPEDMRFFFTAPRDFVRLFRALLCTVRRHLERQTGRLPTEGEAVGAMLEHAFAAWGLDEPGLPKAHRVFARDGWRCTAPGCTSYRNLHDHHIVFRSAGGSDELSNRTTLCAWHHLRGVHAGVVRCAGTAPDDLRFELGVRHGRPPLASYVGERVSPPANRTRGARPENTGK